MSNLVQEKEPQEESTVPQSKNFKVILALKLENNNYGLSNLQCQVQILDKIKMTDLPQQEGQFFDLSELPVGTTIDMEIMTQNQKLGQITINVPEQIINSEETELSNNVVINSTFKNKKIALKFKYYIIILNKKIFLEKNSKKIFRHHELDSTFFDKKDVEKNQSPSTIKFIKSQQEHEDSKYNQVIGKRLLEGERIPKQTKTQKQDISITPPKGDKSVGDIKHNDRVTPTNPRREREQEPDMINPSNPRNYHHSDRVTPTNPRGSQQQESDRITPIKESKTSVSPYSKYNEKPSQKDNKEPKSLNKLTIENEYLKKQILANQSDQNENINQQILKDSLSQSEQRRSCLQDILKNSVDDNIKLKEEIQISLQDSIEKRLQAEKQQQDLQQKNFQWQNRYEDLELELSKRNNQITELEHKNALIEEFVKLCKEQQFKLEAQDKKIKNFQDSGPQYIPKEQPKNISQLKSLTEQLQKSKGDLIKEQGKNNQLQTQIDNLQNKMALESTKLAVLQKIQEQNDKLAKQVKDLREKNEELHQATQDLKQQSHKIITKNTDTEGDELKKTIAQLKRTISDQSNQLDDKNVENLKMKYTIQELKIKLEQKQNKEDMMSHNANLVKENIKLLETVNELTQQLRNTNKQVQDLINIAQLLEARLTAKDYENEAEDKDAYLNDMKRLILQMKERGQVYMPDIKDKTDKALANCLNAKEDYEQIRNMFSRESEGVYQFGSKKLYIKVEQDKVKIRSGGGFISIEEFLQLFSQTEMEKINRQDPLIGLSKNKAMQRKMDDMRLVNSDQISKKK